MSVDLVDVLAPEAKSAPALHLVGGPYAVVDGERRQLPEGGRRILALVALRHSRLERRAVAGELWPVGGDRRAAGNLRSALWRLRCAGVELLEVDGGTLALRPDTTVDVRLASEWAMRLIQGRHRPTDLHGTGWQAAAMDLLPGWYDDWLMFERERLRQRLLHGLEAMSRVLVVADRAAEAVDAALTAVAADPLRESAQQVLAEAHLACGNVDDCVHGIEQYSELLRCQLGVVPGPRLLGLLKRVHTHPATAPAARIRRTVDHQR
ncbi:AfsR/SARP family transcriptional regulator [Pseudonocardia lacus]|uniref:AfsR/SARP family transcriptional regulator n=1 Tax=Pseudonocardia lacus TaxID=2835865 RepID=UPI001BDC86E3|nr:BTAD domain-containing putative transcriptional regulator [Pseudonocardia lacus]